MIDLSCPLELPPEWEKRLTLRVGGPYAEGGRATCHHATREMARDVIARVIVPLGGPPAQQKRQWVEALEQYLYEQHYHLRPGYYRSQLRKLTANLRRNGTLHGLEPTLVAALDAEALAMNWDAMETQLATPMDDIELFV